MWVEEGVRSPDSSGSLDGRFPLTWIWGVNERFELKIFGGVWCCNYTDHGSRKIFLAIFKSWKSPSLKVVVLISSWVRLGRLPWIFPGCVSIYKNFENFQNFENLTNF